MSRILRAFLRPVTHEHFDVRVGQGLMGLASLLVLILGVRKLCGLGLNERDLVLGLLLVLNVSLLLALVGLVLPTAATARATPLSKPRD